MRFRNLAISLTILASWLIPAYAVNFATDRLQTMAKCLSLQQLDTLAPNIHTTAYRYQKHPVRVCVNKYGEVCHIGLKLFADEVYAHKTTPIYDFLERDMLERMLPHYDDQLSYLLSNEHLYFMKGSARTGLSIDGSEEFTEERIDFKRYKATWKRNGETILDILFDMDFQMLSGCNAMELERRYVERLKRFIPALRTIPQPKLTSEESIYVVGGDSLYIKEMNNSIYYERNEQGDWLLTDSPRKPKQTLSNMLLSPSFPRPVSLQLQLKRYTYEEDHMQLPYATWLCLGLEEGCRPYFGVKYKTEAYYEGTVILANPSGGYAHLLSIAVPMVALEGSEPANVDGRLYLYIPLHNVTDQYFKSN